MRACAMRGDLCHFYIPYITTTALRGVACVRAALRYCVRACNTARLPAHAALLPALRLYYTHTCRARLPTHSCYLLLL